MLPDIPTFSITTYVTSAAWICNFFFCLFISTLMKYQSSVLSKLSSLPFWTSSGGHRKSTGRPSTRQCHKKILKISTDFFVFQERGRGEKGIGKGSGKRERVRGSILNPYNSSFQPEKNAYFFTAFFIFKCSEERDPPDKVFCRGRFALLFIFM